MPSTPTSANPDRAEHAFRAQILGIALHHRTHVDARTLVVLQQNGFMNDSQSVTLSGLSPDLLKNQKHPERVQMQAGPLIFRVVGGGHSVADVSDALLSQNATMRGAAIEFLDSATAPDEFTITPRSRQIIQRWRQDVVGNAETWRAGAVAIVDTLNNDILWSLAGLRQAIEARFEEGAVKYVKAVCEPKIESLNTIDLGIWQPRTQRVDVEQLLIEIGEQPTIELVCRTFYEKLGHLPLTGALGLAKPVQRLVDRTACSDDVWKEVWKWADDSESPFARYHACLLFLESPQFVPQVGRERLFTEIVALIAFTPTDGPALGWTALLQRRTILARHYLDHLSCQLPGVHSERTAVLSWWLADRIETALARGEALANKLTDSVISPAVHWSHIGASLARPTSEYSELAYATLHIKSPWALALQCQLAGRVSAVFDIQQLTRSQTVETENSVGAVESNIRESIDSIAVGLAAGAIAMFPAAGINPIEHVYGFDRGIVATANEWAIIEPKEETKKLLEFAVAARQGNADSKNLFEALRNIHKKEERDQIFLLGTLKSLLLQRALPIDDFWKLFDDQGWRDKAFNALTSQGLELLFETMEGIQEGNNDRWRTQLPHLFAAASEAVSNDDRQRLLFAYTVLSCVATNTDSSIRRLLLGTARHKLASEVAFWREQLQQTLSHVSLWIAGRIRPVLAALNMP